MRLHVPNAHPLIPAVATLTVELIARHCLPLSFVWSIAYAKKSRFSSLTGLASFGSAKTAIGQLRSGTCSSLFQRKTTQQPNMPLGLRVTL